MALINGAIRFRRYAVSGKLPADLRTDYEKAIRGNAFADFGEGDDREEALGWVSVQDWFDTDLFPDLWLMDEKISLTLRTDVPCVMCSAAVACRTARRWGSSSRSAC